MSKPILAALLLAAVTAGLLALTRPAAGQLPDVVTDDIVVGNADAIRFENVVANPGLNAVVDSAAARVVVEFANTVRYPVFSSPPSSLATLLGQVGVRIPVEYANAVRHNDLLAPPTGLATVLANVGPRISFEFANANRTLAMSYPRQLINDTTAPVINPPSRDGNKIVWTTDEFTSTLLRYGTNPGQLNQQIADPLFATAHEITIPGLQPGTTYYYQITATDLSGNVTTSPVYQFAGESRIYLPAVQKR